ncbi:MAG: GGDEF domain-containing protein [Alphaproteobacteria bacterium]
MKLDFNKKPIVSNLNLSKEHLDERIALLGIPRKELTPSVHLAVSALLEKLSDVTHELNQARDNLSELERLVDVDCVAPIPNRRAFMRRLSWALNMFERYGHPSTILFFDINDFKELNDQYGHAAGDLAIRHISMCLSSAMRESDFLARIGGDEFAVIMYYADEEAARRRGRLICQKLASNPLSFNDQSIVISSALGCHSLASGDDAESALAAADMSMYVDKRALKEKSA